MFSSRLFIDIVIIIIIIIIIILYTVGREAFSRGFKLIQRDITVANRFIGAALGVRVPQKPRNLAHNQQNRRTSNDIDAAAATSTTATSNPAVIIDAWDD